MNTGAAEPSLALHAPACPQCARPMQAFDLESHYGREVATDLCPHCNVIWFDEFESVRLSGLGWVTLLRRMQAAMEGGAAPLKPQLECPRCRLNLKPVHNLTRFGRFASLECPRRHGHLQTFTLLLAERGLVRPLSHADLKTLQEEKRTPCCLNCGGPIQGPGQCSYCDSPLVVIDMPRLMAALLIRHAEVLPEESAQRVAWPCRGCGAPLEPTHTLRCEHCHHAVVVPSVLDLRPVLDRAEEALRAALPRQARPAGEKLRLMRGDPRATGFNRFLRNAFDLAGDGGPGGLPAWVGWGLLAGAIWFFWY
ncbi:hypothetical protein FN976_18265 [Caenimonas sedimenti]|uniref:Uncharacterized protein n=1 Tax=Caenimonas sedimenti TaxID=2596921 RepID=A0A562ZN86_9BURK|nr:zf-TFIIB domain-containing protein [Caenimonas sedimenti]TWO69765.1 hypothetical protein FN976_18265 [Caenimonas sedimenti]